MVRRCDRWDSACVAYQLSAVLGRQCDRLYGVDIWQQYCCKDGIESHHGRKSPVKHLLAVQVSNLHMHVAAVLRRGIDHAN